MSYILDALKRSEQERKEGELPSFSEHASLMHVKKSNTPLWPYLLIVILLLNLGVFISLNRAPEPRFEESFKETLEEPLEKTMSSSSVSETKFEANTVPASINATRASSPENHSSIKSFQSRTSETKSVTQQEQSVSVDVPSRSQLVTNSADLPEPESGQSGLEKRVETSSLAMSEPESPLSQYMEVEQGTLIRPKSKVGEPLPEGVSVSEPNPTVVVAAQPLSIESATVKQDPALEAYREVPALADMTSSFQRSIPRLVFNSHIYSDVPSARRVMINNIYLREGQEFSGLRVEYIGELEIVFSKSNTLFKLPVMRDWYGA